jgi:hypothetical protein
VTARFISLLVARSALFGQRHVFLGDGFRLDWEFVVAARISESFKTPTPARVVYRQEKRVLMGAEVDYVATTLVEL